MHDSDGEAGDEIVDEVLPPLVLGQPVADRHPLHEQLVEADVGEVSTPVPEFPGHQRTDTAAGILEKVSNKLKIDKVNF